MNAGKKATLDAGNEEGREKLIADDTLKLGRSGCAVKPAQNDDYLARQGKMDRQYVRACKEHGIKPLLNGRISPQKLSIEVVEPQIAEPLSRETVTLRVISEGAEWCDGHRPKWAAFLHVLGLDDRPISEIAGTLKTPVRSMRNYVACARQLIAKTRDEAEGK